MTNLQQQLATLQTAVFSEDYYVHLYEYTLMKSGMTEDGVNRYLYNDSKVVEFANNFWMALPDSPAIRRRPFFLLCDIAEYEFDNSPDWA